MPDAMYIYSKPHDPQPQPGKDAGGGAMKTLATDRPLHPSPSSISPPSPYPPGPNSAAPPSHAILLHRPAAKDGRSSTPFSIAPFFFGPSNPTSTSLVSSTAEGRPIPLDGSTAAHRTSALRELNSNYPSPVLRHRYAKSAGAKSSTYSQPVIVRTYGGPSTPQHGHSKSYSHAGQRPPSASRSGSRRIPLSASSTAAPFFGSVSASKPIGVGVSSIGKHAYGGVLNMGRAKGKKKLPWQWVPGVGGGSRERDDTPKLPPVEAFSFKSFMEDMQEGDLASDLDRIAEICARSKYSLSDQYEVHMAPHGTGAGYVTAGHSGSRKKGRREAGPTLQAVQSDDDENNARTHRKRRSGGRRRSAAYGTLETIMSSSRSSEEDKTKKKSAEELAEDVRGRASRKRTDGNNGSGSGDTAVGVAGDGSNALRSPSAEEARKIARKQSTSFAHAVIDSTRHAAAGTDAASPRSSAAALVSQPSLPQTSSSHLEVRIAPESPYPDLYRHESQPESPTGSGAESPLTQELPHMEDPRASNAGLLAGLSGWIPWRGGPGSVGSRGVVHPRHAEGSLRDLLKAVDDKPNKGKGVQRDV